MITPQQGVVIAGRYTLVRPLARGGMGSVWVAHRRDLEIDVSMKFMDASLVEAPEARALFPGLWGVLIASRLRYGRPRPWTYRTRTKTST